MMQCWDLCELLLISQKCQISQKLKTRGVDMTCPKLAVCCSSSPRKSPCNVAIAGALFWWRFTDSNRGPVDYDSIALTD